MFLDSFCSCIWPIHWSQVLSREWRCSWSSANRRCSNYIWVIKNFIACYDTTYIGGLKVGKISWPGDGYIHRVCKSPVISIMFFRLLGAMPLSKQIPTCQRTSEQYSVFRNFVEIHLFPREKVFFFLSLMIKKTKYSVINKSMACNGCQWPGF